MDKEESKLRVFISYSHEDREVINTIVRVLDDNGLKPMYDKDFSKGTGFHEQIKSYISHAHVFLPVITESSSLRGWVHQEIGYAMALNIPVLPVVIGDGLPSAMMQQLLAVKVEAPLEGLEQQLVYSTFRDLVNRYRNSAAALYECAQLTEDRAEMLARYSRDVLAMNMTGRVRQKGALSSFHIPRLRTSHSAWRRRYGDRSTNEYHCEVLREERKALTEHAKRSGCRIIIDPTLKYEEYGGEARKVRLESLLAFLASEEVTDVQVAIDPEMSKQESVTILGTYFYAQAVSGAVGRGYRQTIFTRHAPSMSSKIERFDDEFDELMEETGWTAASSRERAAQHLREIIATL